MNDWHSMAHVKWECKYHVVILPKCRRKVLFGKRRRQGGYGVSTIGLNEAAIRQYLQDQDKLQQQEETGQWFD
jgi:REP element-mobilizing transposase RayT